MVLALCGGFSTAFRNWFLGWLSALVSRLSFGADFSAAFRRWFLGRLSKLVSRLPAMIVAKNWKNKGGTIAIYVCEPFF